MLGFTDKCQTKKPKDCDILRLKGERITIRLPEKDLRLIDSFLEEEQEFGSRSELLRVGAKALIDKKISLKKGESKETYVPLSDDQVYAIDYLIRKGRFKSREAALFEILRNYLETVDWDKIESSQKKLQDIKYQVESARMMEKELEDRYLKH
jgi:Arc/MetJ-type ribon-helix-helix transcriptional regulator